MSPEQPVTDPESLHALKDELDAIWSRLPAEHQATMALVLASRVMEGELGPWLREAIALQQKETPGQVEESILTQWRRLSPDEQATVLVRQLRDVQGSGLGAPLRRELGLSGEDLEMPAGEETSPVDRLFPITGVSRADLKRAAVSDEVIGQMSDEDMEQIARKMEGYYVDGPFWDDLEVAVKLVLNETGRTPTE